MRLQDPKANVFVETFLPPLPPLLTLILSKLRGWVYLSLRLLLLHLQPFLHCVLRSQNLHNASHLEGKSRKL